MPENTLAAFDDARSRGVDGLELDVRLARDGTPVVIHDRTLDRTTNLRGPVDTFTADELGRADAGYGFLDIDRYPFRGQGIGVPTLTSVLRCYRDLRVIVEMKDATPELARATIAAVRDGDAMDRVCVGAFGRRALADIRAQRDLATSASREEVRWALYRSWVRWPVARPAYDGYQVPEIRAGHRVVSPRFIADAHGAGLPVQVWTVNDPADAERLIAWGADAIITDRPDLILPAVRSRERPT